MGNNNELQLFVDWTKLKIKLHLSDRKLYPKEREIWWVSLGQNVGVEINGKNNNFERPVLVVKVHNSESCLVAPVSSKLRIGNQYVRFINHDGVHNDINLTQLRSISTKRFIRNINKLDESIFIKVKLYLKSI